MGTKVGRKERQNTISEEKHVFEKPEDTTQSRLQIALRVLIEDRAVGGRGSVRKRDQSQATDFAT